MSQCANCLLDLTSYPVLPGGKCPNCGWRPAEQFDSPSSVVPVGPGAPYALFERFWRTLRDIILRPSSFFNEHAQEIVSSEGLSSALAFAVIIQWIASFFNFIWQSTVGAMLQGRINDLFQIASDVMESNHQLVEGIDQVRQRAFEFLFGAGTIVLTPFFTLIKLSVVALFVHAAVRFFMKESQDRRHSYHATLKILSYATAPWIFCIIPGFGLVVGWLLSFTAAVVGFREVYRTTTGRAALAVAFPELLLLSVIFLIVIIGLFLAFNVLRLVF